MKITSAESLALAFKEARVRGGLTQSEAAQAVGIKQATVSAFENHPERSRVDTLFKLMAALGVEMHVTERDQDHGGQAWSEEW